MGNAVSQLWWFLGDQTPAKNKLRLIKPTFWENPYHSGVYYLVRCGKSCGAANPQPKASEFSFDCPECGKEQWHCLTNDGIELTVEYIEGERFYARVPDTDLLLFELQCGPGCGAYVVHGEQDIFVKCPFCGEYKQIREVEE